MRLRNSDAWPAVTNGAVSDDFPGLGIQTCHYLFDEHGHVCARGRFALGSQMLFYFRVGREIMLLVFFTEMLWVRPAVSSPPLVPARLLLVITLLPGHVHFFNQRLPAKYF